MPAIDNFIELKGIRLHYCAWGPADGAPVVLLHGGSAHAHWWELFAESIGDRYRAIAFELRGHGDSAHAQPPVYRLSDYAGDIAAAVAQMRLPAFHLIGHSLGAMIAGVFAVSNPQALSSLTLIDSQMRFSAAAVRYLQRLSRFPHLVYRDQATAIRRFRVLPTETNASRAVIERMGSKAFHQDGDGRWVLKFDRASLAQLEPIDLVPSLAHLDLPICIVRGELSSVLTHEHAKALQDRLPRARLLEIENAHHHVMLDNPSAFGVAMRTFLDERTN